MRPVRMIAGLALLLALGLDGRTEPLTGEVMVAAPVKVRSGPSEAFYPTSELNPGDRVRIMGDKELPWLASKPPPPGWLAIQPPRGSFSWINKRFLTITGATAVVHGETSVRLGSSVYGGLPTVEQMRLQPGAIVTIVGKEQTDVDGIWVPITPAPQEVRYIPAEAVKAASPVQTATAPPPVAPVPAATASSPPPPAAAVPQDPLWAQAEKARQEGKRDEAERLYLQLAQQTRDHDLVIRCWNQIEFLRRGQVAAVPPTPPAPNAAESLYPRPAADLRATSVPGYPNAPPPTVPPIRPASQYTYTPEIPIPTPAQKPQANYSPTPTPAAPVTTLGPGRLLRSAFLVYGQPAYALDLGAGQPVVYVTPSPVLNLEPYVGHNVSVTGPVTYHSGWRKNHLTATQVIPVP